MKIFWFFFVLLTIATVIFAASQKTCEQKFVRNKVVETCEPSTPIGKWLQNNLGINI